MVMPMSIPPAWRLTCKLLRRSLTGKFTDVVGSRSTACLRFDRRARLRVVLVIWVAGAGLLSACSGEPDGAGGDGHGAGGSQSASPGAGSKPQSHRATQARSGAGEDAKPGGVPSVRALNIPNAELEKVLTGLEYPWAFEFIDATRILITEKAGRLSRYDFDSGELTPIAGLPAMATGKPQTGLLDVELHPGFGSNRRIYFSYTIADAAAGEYYLTAVETAVLGEDRLESSRTILRAEPFGWSPSNFGGALEFDDEGYLYVTVGDRSEGELAQEPGSLQGKILRLHDDGSAPGDNPFVGVTGYDERIYAVGVRNPQGLHYDPVSGLMFEAEHGPRGGDEVNIVRAGANYGWPKVTYGSRYNNMAAMGDGTQQSGTEQDLFYYRPAIATSPLTVYRGPMFEEWDGDLLVGALKGQHVSKLDFDRGVIRSEHAMLGEIDSRVRDLKVGPAGALFVLAQNGTLYRLTRGALPRSGRQAYSGQAVYEWVCAGCHETGAYGAPRPGESDAWQRIREQPRETTYQRTIEGFGAMPARGLCNLCSDAELQRAVDYMLDAGGG